MSEEFFFYREMCLGYSKVMSQLKSQLQNIVKATEYSRDLKRASLPKYFIQESCSKRIKCYFNWIQENEKQEKILLDSLKNDSISLENIIKEQKIYTETIERREKEIIKQIEKKKKKISWLKKSKNIFDLFTLQIEQQIRQTSEEIFNLRKKQIKVKERIKNELKCIVQKSVAFLHQKENLNEFYSFYKQRILSLQQPEDHFKKVLETEKL